MGIDLDFTKKSLKPCGYLVEISDGNVVHKEIFTKDHREALSIQSLWSESLKYVVAFKVTLTNLYKRGS